MSRTEVLSLVVEEDDKQRRRDNSKEGQVGLKDGQDSFNKRTNDKETRNLNELTMGKPNGSAELVRIERLKSNN
jgi:hypothetical protein